MRGFCRELTAGIIVDPLLTMEVVILRLKPFYAS
jgi:hypothetical protein